MSGSQRPLGGDTGTDHCSGRARAISLFLSQVEMRSSVSVWRADNGSAGLAAAVAAIPSGAAQREREGDHRRQQRPIRASNVVTRCDVALAAADRSHSVYGDARVAGRGCLCLGRGQTSHDGRALPHMCGLRATRTLRQLCHAKGRARETYSLRSCACRLPTHSSGTALRTR